MRSVQLGASVSKESVHASHPSENRRSPSCPGSAPSSFAESAGLSNYGSNSQAPDVGISWSWSLAVLLLLFICVSLAHSALNCSLPLDSLSNLFSMTDGRSFPRSRGSPHGFPSARSDSGVLGGSPSPLFDRLSRSVYFDNALLFSMYSNVSAHALSRLLTAEPDSSEHAHFDYVEISLPLPATFAEAGDGQAQKALVGRKFLQSAHPDRSCVVYGVGIADQSDFEEEMSLNSGCEVHGFDCSIRADSAAVVNKHFLFHPWCIGTVQKSEELIGGEYNKSDVSGRKWMTLSEVRRTLNHTHVDVLKFDIEGHEWKLFETEFLSNLPKNSRSQPDSSVQEIEGRIPRNDLSADSKSKTDVDLSQGQGEGSDAKRDLSFPSQLLFELHSEGTNPAYVPEDLTRGKGTKAINELFRQLWQLGYRVTGKDLNGNDDHACEFVMLKIR